MGTTPNRALPYPEPTDPVAAGAAAIEDLATAVDSALPTPTSSATSSDAGTVATADAWTTGIAGGAALAPVSVTIPGSGRVLVIMGATLWLSVGTGQGTLGVRLSGTAMGATVDPAAENTMKVASGPTRFGASRAFMVSGKVPGTVLTGTMVYKTASTGTTMSVADRRLDIIPLP